MGDPYALWGAAIDSAAATVAKAREVVALSRNMRHVAALQRVLASKKRRDDLTRFSSARAKTQTGMDGAVLR